jgi:hypothetical protein
MIDNFEDLRTAIQAELDNIENGIHTDKDGFLTQLKEHEARIYLAGMKYALYTVKRMVG